MSFEPPSWEALASSARPAIREPDKFEPGGVRQGWQHEAASRVERQFRDQVLFERLPAQDKAMIRSQAGPGAGTALSIVPTSFLTHPSPSLSDCPCVASAGGLPGVSRASPGGLPGVSRGSPGGLPGCVKGGGPKGWGARRVGAQTYGVGPSRQTILSEKERGQTRKQPNRPTSNSTS